MFGICPRTDAYFGFATNAEIGSRQGEHNSTKTSSVEIIKFPISLTLFLLFRRSCLSSLLTYISV